MALIAAVPRLFSCVELSAPSAEVDNGYNVLHWTKDGMTFWAVSDVQAADLEELARLLQGRK